MSPSVVLEKKADEILASDKWDLLQGLVESLQWSRASAQGHYQLGNAEVNCEVREIENGSWTITLLGIEIAKSVRTKKEAQVIAREGLLSFATFGMQQRIDEAVNERWNLIQPRKKRK